MTMLFVIIFGVGWLISLIETRTYYKKCCQLARAFDQEVAKNKQYEQAIEEQSILIDSLENTLQEKEFLLDAWKSGGKK